MHSRAIAQLVLDEALQHCYRQCDLEDWAPPEYLELENDDRNLIDREIAGLLT